MRMVLRLILAALALASFGLFAFRFKQLLDYLKIGVESPIPRTDDGNVRLKETAKYVLAQICSRKEPYISTGIMHTAIFWGFLLLFPTAVEAVLRIAFPEFSFAFLGRYLYGGLTLLQDIFALGVFVAICGAAVRRFIVKPKRVDNHWDAPVILGLIAGVVITFFAMNMAEIQLGEKAVRPISGILHALLGPHTTTAASSIYTGAWALHTAILLVFVPLLLYSKHMHIIAGVPNIYLQNKEGFKQHRMDFENAEFFGVNRIDQLSWKDLLDTYACTYCNRCTDQCPANNTGKPLEPGMLIQNLRDALLEDAPEVIKLKKEDKLPPPDEECETVKPLIDRVISRDAIWSCTTCGACLSICPVLNEHPQKIVEMRRYLTLMESDIAEELQITFRNLENNSNPWGVGFANRADWAEGLDIPLISDNPDAEYLLWVGCAGAYDDRYKKVMKDLVTILKAADVSFAILGVEEKCCGDSARRLGNEYLFEMMATEVAELLNSYNVKKIITACPHGYHTFKHEYSQYGWNGEVWHHSQFIAKLIREKKIRFNIALPHRTIYHDSCYLGRHNNIYDEPRYILRNLVPEEQLTEMDRNHERSFCCGAGGGRMWMEEKIGDRINVVRCQEALTKNPDKIVTACPFCLTMFEDGVKDAGKEEEVSVRDIAELVARAIEPPQPEA